MEVAELKQLIITADDFGSSPAVNEAVERAHRRGVLGAASLMVAGEAAADAVERARRLGSLRVGLHLTLVDGFPVSPPETIPCLVDAAGRLPSALFAAGVDFFFRTETRRQLEREMRAQFEAFRDTGLVLDHADCHRHMHLHPVVGRLLVTVGREFGLKAVRFPCEPVLPSWRAARSGLGNRLLARIFLLPWLPILRWRLRRGGARSNDFVFGMNDSGKMNPDLLLGFIRELPPGVTEIYFHPAWDPAATGGRHGHESAEDFAALTSPAVMEAIRESGIRLTVFSALADR